MEYYTPQEEDQQEDERLLKVFNSLAEKDS
jgi:hypothetical protein